MSRQEQNDRHIIWSDISLDLDDWRESLEELYPGYSDDELYDIMVKSNAENLYDERVNLNIQLSQPIIVIGDLGRWNGRVSGYKMIDSGNIKGVQLRKHSKAREKRYSFGYAVSFIFACYQILWTFPKSLYLCSRYLLLAYG